MFDNIKNKVSQYIQIRFEELRLEIFERIVNIVGYILFIFVSLFFVFISFIFLGLSLATYLGNVMNSMALGYLSTFGVFLLGGIILFLSSKSVITFFSSKLIKLLTSKHKNEIE